MTAWRRTTAWVMGPAVVLWRGAGRGDIAAVREAAARLARIDERLGGGFEREAQTDGLLSSLLARSATRARWL
ncbi:hypothetical protein OG612_02090 [Streptomyces sp. NBC_01527]|uniref:hypothetical protein n=1 Tax=unclassified Streptomyces TaxID=2593676 RepID=UPI002E0FA072|nr:hypothetical protein OG763_41560 [Streptomyces sp. NBC_01230]